MHPGSPCGPGFFVPGTILAVWSKSLYLVARMWYKAVVRFTITVFVLIGMKHAASCQNLDSLERISKTGTIEQRVDALKMMTLYYFHTDTVKAKQYTLEALRIAREADYEKGIIMAHENLGRYYTEHGQYDSAMVAYNFVILNYDVPEHNTSIAACLIGMGNVYDISSNFEKALECYLEAEKRYEQVDNHLGLGLAQMGIGNIYNTTSQHREAKIYFRRSYKNLLETSELYAAWSMNNLATSMMKLGEYDSAVLFFERSLEIKLKLNDVYGASYTYSDLGELYKEKGEDDLALNYFLKALESKEALEGISKETVSGTSLGIAEIYYRKKNYLTAVFYFQQGLDFAKQSSSLMHQSRAYKGLANSKYKAGNYKDAFDDLSAHLRCVDSLNKQMHGQSLAELQSKYDADQKQKEIELLNTSNKVSQLEAEKANKKTQTITFYLVGAVIIIILAAGLGISLFRSSTARRKANELLLLQKNEIQHQKELVEEKNKEVLDSITYAKRLQQAILPPLKTVKQHLPESFLLYKPKDIVAGDFYWFEHQDNLIFIAAADCTGHGVPGAMVSVVCSNALNRAVKEFGMREPGKILDKVRELVVETFEKSEEEVKDGMDVSLCVIDSKNARLQWAGANNPLWMIRAENGAALDEIKPDKQPIGKYTNPKPFTTHTVQLNPGDIFYIFTDGYADQFGGDNGKKFKASNLRELFVSICKLPMPDQQIRVTQVFDQWKGSYEQLDDICVIGVRL
jgi:serine phosphatase RsbU (regulator of sigma subunit)